jgi:tetratricopeptide (TPR) repeat protein
MAYYRIGDWHAADDALQNSIKFARDGNANAYDWLLLAMIRGEQGRADEARQWRQKARDWIAAKG